MASRQLDEKTVTGLVADAAAAPSMHNAQPWRFRFLTGERVLLLRADPERAMPRSDPDNRALHIGCGAALFNLRVAAAHANLLPEVRVLPEPQDPLLLAAVHLTDEAGRPQDQDLARLHPAIPSPRRISPRKCGPLCRVLPSGRGRCCSSPDFGTPRPCST